MKYVTYHYILLLLSFEWEDKDNDEENGSINFDRDCDTSSNTPFIYSTNRFGSIFKSKGLLARCTSWPWWYIILFSVSLSHYLFLSLSLIFFLEFIQVKQNGQSVMCRLLQAVVPFPPITNRNIIWIWSPNISWYVHNLYVFRWTIRRGSYTIGDSFCRRCCCCSWWYCCRCKSIFPSPSPLTRYDE